MKGFEGWSVLLSWKRLKKVWKGVSGPIGWVGVGFTISFDEMQCNQWTKVVLILLFLLPSHYHQMPNQT